MPFIPSGFPDYEYRPYPKFVILADGTQAVADDADQEAALLGATDDADAAERQLLIDGADAKGIKIDRRWSTDKIRAALA